MFLQIISIIDVWLGFKCVFEQNVLVGKNLYAFSWKKTHQKNLKVSVQFSVWEFNNDKTQDLNPFNSFTTDVPII